MSRVRILQLGEEDLSVKYPVAKDGLWLYEPDMTVAPEKDYDVVILSREVSEHEAKYLYLYTKAYCLFVLDSVRVEQDTEWIYKSKKGQIIDENQLKNLMAEEVLFYFPKPYGEKFSPNHLSISQNYKGKIISNGFTHCVLDGDYGETFTQVAFWRTNIPIEPEQPIDFWLEYEKDDTVSIQMSITLFKSGYVSEIAEVITFSETDLKNVVSVRSKIRSLAFVSISAKGSGRLKVIALHDRFSRSGKGSFLPGGNRFLADNREEVFWYFDPGDMKPPLNVYFSGYKTQEGFEGYNMMRGMGAPFILISEARLEGGAFYLGNEQYEKSIVDIIDNCRIELGFSKDDVILSGLSMGTFGALYYGCDIRPHAIILGKPLASLGNVASNERINRPGGFPTSLDVLWKQYGGLDDDDVSAMNHRFWEKFDKADWSKTKFEISYMIEDDYDSNAYKLLLSHCVDSGVQVYGKGLHGRHNDDTAGIVKWFIGQYYKTLRKDFNRSAEKREYAKKEKKAK